MHQRLIVSDAVVNADLRTTTSKAPYHGLRRKNVGDSCCRHLLAAAVCLSLTGCHLTSNADPAIEFTVVPVAAVGGSYKVAEIAGRVLAARPDQRIVVYAKSGRVWWIQPVVAQPFTTIAANSTWKNTIHLGLEYAALLVDQRFRPPATMESLPARGGAVVAIATVKGSGEFRLPKPARLTFSGYEWEIRQVPSDRYGANDFDARNAWVDADGMLHLMVVQRDGRWTSAEVRLTRALGYGSYAFGVTDTSALDPAVTLGMFTWDDLGEYYHRELDIEIGRWGDPDNKDGQYVVQPEYVAENVFRFFAPPGRLTHAFRWEPGHVSFRTIRGTARSETLASVVAQREFASGVPVPGAEAVHINLLYFRMRKSDRAPASSSPRLLEKDAEVVIEKFQYLP
jgi:hypothetical protein